MLKRFLTPLITPVVLYGWNKEILSCTIETVQPRAAHCALRYGRKDSVTEMMKKIRLGYPRKTEIKHKNVSLFQTGKQPCLWRK